MFKDRNSKFVICVNNAGYPASLELHKVYRVLPDDDAEQDGDLRVIDESGEDYLFPAEFFVPVQLADDTAVTLEESFAGSSA